MQNGNIDIWSMGWLDPIKSTIKLFVFAVIFFIFSFFSLFFGGFYHRRLIKVSIELVCHFFRDFYFICLFSSSFFGVFY